MERSQPRKVYREKDDEKMMIDTVKRFLGVKIDIVRRRDFGFEKKIF